MIHILIISFCAVFLTQLIKLVIDAFNKNFSWRDLNSYGGFPSSHTAFTTALTLAVGYFEGWSSSAFIICLVFSIIIIRDAVGLRIEVGKHAKILNDIIKHLPDESQIRFEHLKERIGHSSTEVLGGFFVGGLITLTYILIVL